MYVPARPRIRTGPDVRAFAARVAFRAGRQITKTKPSIREDRRTGAFHRLTRRPHACPGTHTRASKRRRAVWLVLFEPGSLRSRLRFGVTRPRSKRKRNRLPGCPRFLYVATATPLAGQRSPSPRNRFNDRPPGAPGVPGFLIGAVRLTPAPRCGEELRRAGLTSRLRS